jgi:hypothetical protein
MTVLYLKAANVARLYVNMEAGPREEILLKRLNNSMAFIYHNNSNENITERYGYFEVPLANPHWTQAIDGRKANEVLQLEPGCRVIFMDEYCGSHKEEFIMTDPKEVQYLQAYVALLEEPYQARADFNMIHPEKYEIDVRNAVRDTAIVLKMTHDENFKAYVQGDEVEIKTFGPDYMLIIPNKEGSYTIDVEYNLPASIRIGGIISLISLALILIVFLLIIPILNWINRNKPKREYYIRGDM